MLTVLVMGLLALFGAFFAATIVVMASNIAFITGLAGHRVTRDSALKWVVRADAVLVVVMWYFSLSVLDGILGIAFQ